MPTRETTRPAIRLPDAPTLVVGVTRAIWVTTDGEVEELDRREAVARLRDDAVPLLCHAPAAARRLGIDPFPAFDLLELFAFVRPAAFCVPTPRGLADALDIDLPGTLAESATALRRAAVRLLGELTEDMAARGARPTAQAMAGGGWVWGDAVLHALGVPRDERMHAAVSGLDVWRHIPEWPDHAPPPPPGSEPVSPDEARRRLSMLLGGDSEERPSQADYASAATAAFLPREAAGEPRFVLAEAGTGVGKTMGYLAPASVWSEKNEAPVWVSTYTRNLQHQIDQELDRLFPEPATKANRVVVRKGRENYLCLLNMEDAAKGVAVRRRDAIALGLMARWAARSRDGSLTGGDFPAWLVDLLGTARTVALSDHRGECIYAACDHFRRCYVEKSIRKARRAEIVVANHALVMTQMARGLMDEGGGPTRFVFDEGHHLFDAADSAFSAHFTGHEARELRRWIRGAEGRGRRRGRGLKLRVEDLLGESGDAADALDKIVSAAAALPDAGWHQRCADGRPSGPAEAFLAAVRHHAYARTADPRSPYDIEADTTEPSDALLETAAALEGALHKLEQEISRLRNSLIRRLDEEADDLDTATRIRIESVCRSLQFRAETLLRAWRYMLTSLAGDNPDEFVDWFTIDRIDGRDFDVGMHRHWIDPTVPFAGVVAAPAHGVLVTSATLRDGTGNEETDWQAAETRTGALHLPSSVRAAVPSPFAYAEQTRVFVVNDVRKDDLAQVAAAYRALFVAAGGGALGLFTAISRLRAVYERIAAPLDEAGLQLYAQHVDRVNLSTLVDIFRAERDSCLLGTDAVRDGVDVPGDSLRLIVFDRVPWPRPTILHRARRKAFGGRAYDDMQTRLRIKQAYGRLVRRASDRGVFVLLDPMMPSRLGGAFPEGVEIVRQGLADTVAACRTFLDGTGAGSD
jgi:ATP-dependent DNA helicase DinG